MREKGIWKILAVFMVLVTIVSCAAMPSAGGVSESEVTSSSATIYVPDDYLTIQEAVNAASAGDTIIVRDGTYIENIEVDKRLTIRSENGPDSTIVRAEDPYEHAFNVSADYVNISGFTVKGANMQSIGFSDGSIWSKTPVGIQLHYADYCNISNNDCSNNALGIGLYNSNNNSIYYNTCSSCMYSNVYRGSSNVYGSGIVLSNSNNNSIYYNTCSNNQNGIALFESNDNTIASNNTCSSNKGHGIVLDDSNNNSIANNNCSSNNRNGIDLRDSNNNSIANNNCSSNCWYSIVTNNSISKATSNIGYSTLYMSNGIYLSGSNNNSISSNNCSSNGEVGIHLQDSDNNSISSNNCSSNSLDGIYLSGSNDNSITNNRCSSKWHGIDLRDSSNNKLTGNTMLESGINIKGDSLSDYIHEINETNTVNGKPVYYWKDVEGGRIPDGAGQVILVNCTNITIENQNLNNASIGIQIVFSSDVTIKGNICSNDLDSIYLSYSNNNNISNNNCSNNRGGGIYLEDSNNNSISDNICSNNDYGIYLIHSNNNLIKNNNVSNNGHEYLLFQPLPLSSIKNNNVSNNAIAIITAGISIYLFKSSDNKIYLNDFINNTKNVYSSDSTNIWNSKEEITYTYNGSQCTNYIGNYWDDYKGKYPYAEEIDEIGVWDTPYRINSDKDYYPLMDRVENYFVSTKAIFRVHEKDSMQLKDGLYISPNS